MCRSHVSLIEQIAGIPPEFVVTCGFGVLLLTWNSRVIEAGEHREAETCHACRYRLDGLSKKVRCPECGTEDARLRHEIERVERDYGLMPKRAFAYLVLAVLMLLGSWVHHEILRAEYNTSIQRWYVPPGIIYPASYPAYSASGWVAASPWVAWLLTWIAAKFGRGLVLRAAVCGGVFVVIATLSALAASPVSQPGDVHRGTVGGALCVLVLAYAAAGLFSPGVEKESEEEPEDE